jgi:serine/threonine-protein kinase RsbW
MIEERARNACASVPEKVNIVKEQRKILKRLSPQRVPVIKGLHVESMYNPGDPVGGSFLDIIQLSKDVYAFVVFDVFERSENTALWISLVRALVQEYLSLSGPPHVVLDRMNEEILKSFRGELSCASCVAFLDLHDNKLIVSNSGNITVFLARKAVGALEVVPPSVSEVGIYGDAFFDEKQIHCLPGDIIVLGTTYTKSLLKDRFQHHSPGNDGRISSLFDTLWKSPESISRHLSTLTPSSGRTDIAFIAVEILTQSRKEQLKEQLGFPVTDPVYLQSINYFEEMDAAIGTVLKAMDNAGYADETIRRMKIVLTELVSNAISHGNKRDFSKMVYMGHIVDSRKTTVSVMDEGKGFDPESVPDPTLPENIEKDCGRGLYIVRRYVDRIIFNEAGNRVTITRHRIEQ